MIHFHIVDSQVAFLICVRTSMSISQSKKPFPTLIQHLRPHVVQQMQDEKQMDVGSQKRSPRFQRSRMAPLPPPRNGLITFDRDVRLLIGVAFGRRDGAPTCRVMAQPRPRRWPRSARLPVASNSPEGIGVRLSSRRRRPPSSLSDSCGAEQGINSEYPVGSARATIAVCVGGQGGRD